MKCLITGCEGFVGSHLADLLRDRNLPVFGMVHGDTANIAHLRGEIDIFECDLNDRDRVESIVSQVRPDIVFHLAAQSFVTLSWKNPEETLRTNVIGSFFLMDAIRKADLSPTILLLSSSAVYGAYMEPEMPLSEHREFRPTSIYAVSKVAEDTLGYFFWRAYEMRVIRVRPFSMTGPRKTLDACSDFARGIAEIEGGWREIVEVGNLETVRDITDGRDAVKALWLIAERGMPGDVYNLCTGRALRLHDVLEMLISISGRRIQYKQVPDKLRPRDDPIYVGDNSKLRALGWEPQIPFKQTLSDTLSYWREKLLRAPK
jgi:GDP-4-dehydro-6-deoxy-D-mannose reductase